MAYDFDESFCSIPVKDIQNYLVIPMTHTKAEESNLRLSHFADDTFITVSESESPALSSLIVNSCREAGFEPKIRVAPTVGSMGLWVEAGYGICGLNCENILYGNPKLQFLKVPELNNIREIAVWKNDNWNPSIPLFINLIENIKRNHSSCSS